MPHTTHTHYPPLILVTIEPCSTTPVELPPFNFYEGAFFHNTLKHQLQWDPKHSGYAVDNSNTIEHISTTTAEQILSSHNSVLYFYYSAEWTTTPAPTWQNTPPPPLLPSHPPPLDTRYHSPPPNPSSSSEPTPTSTTLSFSMANIPPTIPTNWDTFQIDNFFYVHISPVVHQVGHEQNAQQLYTSKHMVHTSGT